MRYKQINRYGKTMIMEQDAPPPPPEEDPNAVPPSPDAAGAPPAPDALGGAPTDAPPPPPPADDTLGAVPTDAAPTDDAGLSPEADTTEEIDITDLVNMTKNIKKELENTKQDNGSVISKMDDLFSKLSDLESKLGEMDAVIAKIDQLGDKVEQMKPETPVEKLEMRSLDSYPFNEKPQQFFDQKQAQMRQSGKNEYVLTKDDVDNYSPDDIKQSFNQTNQEDEYKF